MCGKILKIDPEDIDETLINECAEHIRNNKILILPTDTVYGICANAFSKEAVKKIFDIKNRPGNKPLSILIANIRQLSLLTNEIPKDALMLIERFWPGPLTIIFRKTGKVFNDLTGSCETVGVRITSNPITKQIIEKSMPIVASSANLSGEKSPSSFTEINTELIQKVDYAIDAGKTLLKKESTIITVYEKPFRVIREGAIPIEEISRFVNITKE